MAFKMRKNPMQRNFGIGKKSSNLKDESTDLEGNNEYVKKSKTTSFGDDGEKIKRTVRDGGYVTKEKIISPDGTEYYKTKTKGDKTKTKSGRTLKGFLQDITGVTKRKRKKEEEEMGNFPTEEEIQKTKDEAKDNAKKI